MWAIYGLRCCAGIIIDSLSKTYMYVCEKNVNPFLYHLHSLQKNLLGLGVLFSGYGAAILVFRWLWSNGVEFMLNNLFYILIYTVVSGIASFAFLYWRGPASVRTLSLLQWALQLIGLLLVWSSCQLQTVSVVLLSVVIVFYHTRLRLMGVFNHW